MTEYSNSSWASIVNDTILQSIIIRYKSPSAFFESNVTVLSQCIMVYTLVGQYLDCNHCSRNRENNLEKTCNADIEVNNSEDVHVGVICQMLQRSFRMQCHIFPLSS